MSAYVVILLAGFVGVSVVAYFFSFQLGVLRSKEESLRHDADAASTQAQKAQKDLETLRDEMARRKSEAAELREKLNDLRARQHKQRETDRRQKGSAEEDLTEQLDIAARRLEDERGRVDVLSRESAGMQAELTKLRDAQGKLSDALKAAQAAAAARAAAPVVVAAAAAPAADGAAVLNPLAEKAAEMEKRAEVLDKQLRESRRKAAELDEEVKRARGKASTMTRNHLLAKSELDLFREKLVWSEKRVVELEKLLFDNKISLPEREVAPQPTALQLAPGTLARESANTGGEGVVAISADYVPEPSERNEVTTPGTPIAVAERAPEAVTEAAASTVAEAAPSEEDNRPSAVPPIRRPRASVEEEAAAKAE